MGLPIVHSLTGKCQRNKSIEVLIHVRNNLLITIRCEDCEITHSISIIFEIYDDEKIMKFYINF